MISFDHCVIHVADWARSNAFYRRAPRAGRPVMPGGNDLRFAWHGPIEAAPAHLDAHGVAVELGPVRRFDAKGPGTSLHFRDPDGSLLELISYG